MTMGALQQRRGHRASGALRGAAGSRSPGARAYGRGPSVDDGQPLNWCSGTDTWRASAMTAWRPWNRATTSSSTWTRGRTQILARSGAWRSDPAPPLANVARRTAAEEPGHHPPRGAGPRGLGRSVQRGWAPRRARGARVGDRLGALPTADAHRRDLRRIGRRQPHRRGASRRSTSPPEAARAGRWTTFEDVDGRVAALAARLGGPELASTSSPSRMNGEAFRLHLAVPPVGPGSWRLALNTLASPAPPRALGAWWPAQSCAGSRDRS